MWKKNQEPEVLTLSSDEDEENTTFSSIKTTLNVGSCETNSRICEPLNPKEPTIIPNSDYIDWQMYHQNISCNKFEYSNSEDSSFFVSLHCQSVRIGSYKVVPQEKLALSPKEIKIVVPPFAEGETDPVCLIFPVKNIRKILAHLEAQVPLLFAYVMDPLARKVRQLLKMNDEKGFYFDPCSSEESQKRLTIIPESLQQNTIILLRNIFNFSLLHTKTKEEIPLFEELTVKDANEILVRSSPVEIESLAINARPSTYETKTLLVYPAPPNKGGITITVDDYLCLKEEQFLNDVLIDFYLKWLHMVKLNPEDRERTHLFSTFFYKRLTAKPKNNHRPNYETDPKLSPAERRHARVQSWTKNVDIFSKDFLLIPINEKSHWFLAVICFPYLNGPVNAETKEAIPVAETTLPSRRVSSRVKQKAEIPIIDDNESDRDEAEGDDCELEDYDGDDDDPQPCILILDSISGSPRSRIVSTLRDYLSVEHTKRKKKSKIFTKDNMMGACPKVPQQTNYTDCGVFTLQYAESFFETPLKDFRLPIRSLEDWFEQKDVAEKRMNIANLIKSLMDKLKPNNGIVLPSLCVSNQEETRGPVEDEKGSSQNNYDNGSVVEADVKDDKCSNNSNDISSQKCPDEVSSNNSNHSSKSVEVELSDAAEPLDINGFDLKNVPKIIVPIKNLSSSTPSTTSNCTSSDNDSNITNNNKDDVSVIKRVTRIGSTMSSNSCQVSTLKAKRISNSFQLLCDSYSKMDDDDNSDKEEEEEEEDDDEIFISDRNKRLKLSTAVNL
ncbi:Sentrin-specific protease 7 [Armadillidium vulgare]|nr:Sentrin-specific protease 7 [Armadillidium vulgare]